VTTSPSIVVTILPVSAYPIEGMISVNTEFPDEVAVMPVSALLVPVSSMSEDPNCEVVMVAPEIVFQSPEAFHSEDELSDADIVPPEMALLLPSTEISTDAPSEVVTVKPPSEL